MVFLMMSRLYFYFLILLTLAQTACTSSSEVAVRLTEPMYSDAGKNSLRIFCYHDIRDNLEGTFKSNPDSNAVDTKAFVDQLSWLHSNGWVSIGIDELVASRNGGKPLPEKAFMLTFDDGYRSHYTHVYPLLQAFKFKAIYGLVGEWLVNTPDGNVNYAGEKRSRDKFLTWPQVNEMVKSGLVEIASHSHNLHKGHLANPQGNMQPAAIARIFNATAQNNAAAYEDDVAYHSRIKRDLASMNALIKQHTGITPRAVIWPYGRYNSEMLNIAKEESLPIAFSLYPGLNVPSVPLDKLKREHIVFNTSLSDFVNHSRSTGALSDTAGPFRVVHVDLDAIYNPDVQQQENNLSKLIDQIYDLGPSTVFLKAFSDTNNDGLAEALYFPNRHLPMRSDLFNRAAWQLNTRVGLRVFAWMPVSAFDLTALSNSKPLINNFVMNDKFKGIVTELYEDLGKNSRFDGVLFDDESDKNTNVISPLKNTLVEKLKTYHPNLLTAHRLSARTVFNDLRTKNSTSSYQQYLNTYDYVALTTEQDAGIPKDSNTLLKELIEQVSTKSNGLRRTIFEIPTVDYATNKKIDEKILSKQFNLLRLQGARNLTYYPYRFENNHPAVESIKESFSLHAEPVKR
jgi:poly-beta-1,6-N-acetyl-D-glucosamine N-deacetylase